MSLDKNVLSFFGFKLFSVLFSLLQTLRGITLFPINPVAVFLILTLWNTLKLYVSKSYKTLLIYISVLFIITLLFSECLNIFSITGEVFIAKCSYYLIFSLMLFSVTILLSLILILSYLLIFDKTRIPQINSQITLYITAAFTYLDSFYIRASKDEISLFITIFLMLFVIFKHINEIKVNFTAVAAVLFIFVNLLIDLSVIFKPEIINTKTGIISIVEYIYL